jgi:hypothetical protein
VNANSKSLDTTPEPLDLMRVQLLVEMPDSVADLLLEGDLQEQFLDGADLEQMPQGVQDWIQEYQDSLDN